MDWAEPALDAFGLMLSCPEATERLLIWFNRSHDSLSVTLPAAQSGYHWARDKLVCEGRSITTLFEVPDLRKSSSQPDDIIINDLASAAGIHSEWWEVNGSYHSVGIETKRALLAAMALPIATQGEALESLEQLRSTKHNAQVPIAGRCYQPEFLRQGKRVTGLTSHLYALRHESDGGIGDFETLARFCETSSKLGGSLAGINPCITCSPMTAVA